MYKNLTGTKSTVDRRYSAVADDLAQYSDITLVTNTNKNLPNRYFRFHDCFPISLGALELQSGAEAEPVTCQVSFRFSYYDIKNTFVV